MRAAALLAVGVVLPADGEPLVDLASSRWDLKRVKELPGA
jgi:hypothetical protein